MSPLPFNRDDNIDKDCSHMDRALGKDNTGSPHTADNLRSHHILRTDHLEIRHSLIILPPDLLKTGRQILQNRSQNHRRSVRLHIYRDSYDNL